MRRYSFLLMISLFLATVQMADAKRLVEAFMEESPSAVEIKALIDAGADVNFIDTTGGNTQPPIVWAARNAKDPEIIDILCSHGAKLTDGPANNPLLCAASANPELAVIKKLVERGSNLTAKDDENNTALILALKNNENLEVVRYFLNSNIDINEKNKDNEAALFVAMCGRGFEEEELIPITKEILRKSISADRNEAIEQLIKVLKLNYQASQESQMAPEEPVVAWVKQLGIPDAEQIVAYSLKANSLLYAAEQIVKHYEPSSPPLSPDPALEAVLTTASDYYRENGFKEFIFGQPADNFQLEDPSRDEVFDLIGICKGYSLGFRDRKLVQVFKTYAPVADYTSVIKFTFGEITEIASGVCKEFGPPTAPSTSFSYGKQVYPDAVLVTNLVRNQRADAISIGINSKPFIKELFYKLSPEMDMHLKIFKDIVVERKSKPFSNLDQDNLLPLPDSAKLKDYLSKTSYGFSLSVLNSNKDNSSDPGISFNQSISNGAVSGYKGYISINQLLDTSNTKLLRRIMDYRCIKPIFNVYFASLAMKHFPPEGGKYYISTDSISFDFSYNWVCDSLGAITVTNSTVVVSSAGNRKEL